MGPFVPLMIVVVSGCGPGPGGGPGRDPVTTPSDTSGEVDSDAPATDTAAPTVSDTGRGTTTSRLTTSGVILCEDPSARERLGPMIRTELPTHFADEGFLWRSAGVVMEDLTGDGLYDLFLAEPNRSTLWVGDGTGGFVDDTEGRIPAPETPHAGYGGSAADADGDGDLDLYLTSNGGQDLVFLNDGTGVFTESVAGLPVETWLGGTSAAWGDMDGDRDLDLIVSNFRDEDDIDIPPIGDPNTLLENLGDGTFADVSTRLDRLTRGALTFVASWIDHDLDGDLDLYFVNDMGPVHVPNKMLSNLGDGTFVDVSIETGTAVAINGMGLGIGDLNGDRIPDFAMSTIGPPVILESLLGNLWIQTSGSRGIEMPDGFFVGWGTDLVDLDNDGDLDMSMAVSQLTIVDGQNGWETGPDEVWLQQPDGNMVRVAGAWGMDHKGYTRGAAFGDIDDNGFLDLVKRDRDGPTQVYMARCGAEGWLRVRLRAPGPNTYGVGATVEVEGGGRRWVEWLRAGGSNLASSAPIEAHFGLGDLDAVDSLRVTWPDGEVWDFGQMSTRQILTLAKD